jgi:RNA recognition motif. (a.k.a. RRM, RBD, or RNP domain)
MRVAGTARRAAAAAALGRARRGGRRRRPLHASVRRLTRGASVVGSQGETGPLRHVEDEYQTFLASLGGQPGGGGGGGGREREHSHQPQRYGLGMAPPGRSRPGDDLPDDCKLYVGNLAQAFTDDTLRQMFEPFGNVLHSVVIKEHETGALRGVAIGVF